MASPDKKKRQKKRSRERPVSLNPLEFKEALADLLKVKPEVSEDKREEDPKEDKEET